MTPKTKPTTKPAHTTTDGGSIEGSALAPAVDAPPGARRDTVHLVVWALVGVAVIAGLALLLSRTGVESEVATETATTDVLAPDPVVGRELYFDDVRSIGRVDPVDPVAGRALYFEDLRSIGRDADAWRGPYFDDVRSIGRVDPVAGRELYFEDLRSIGRTTP